MWIYLALVGIKVNLLEHELTCLFTVRDLADKHEVVQSNVLEVVNAWVVGLLVLVVRLAAIKESTHGLAWCGLMEP